MQKLIKNLPHSAVMPLAGQVQILDGQIVSKTLAQSSHCLLYTSDAADEL